MEQRESVAIGTSLETPNATCITTKWVGNTNGNSKRAMTGEFNNINVATGSALVTMGNSTYWGTNRTGGTEQRMQSAVPIQVGLYRRSVQILKDMTPAQALLFVAHTRKRATVTNMQKTIGKELGNNKPNSVQSIQYNKGVISAVTSKRLSNVVSGKDRDRIFDTDQKHLQKVGTEIAISIQRTMVNTMEVSDSRSNQSGWSLVERSNKRRNRKATDG